MPVLQEALNPTEIENNLKSLNEWTFEGNAIVRTVTFPGFIRAIEFVNAVAHLSERLQHHPDIEVRYQEVTLRYWTHTANGVTELDFKAAKEAEAMIPFFKSAPMEADHHHGDCCC